MDALDLLLPGAARPLHFPTASPTDQRRAFLTGLVCHEDEPLLRDQWPQCSSVNCIRGYGNRKPRFLDKPIASLVDKKGYRRFFHPGQRPDAIPPGASPTSVKTWAYVAVPVVPGASGIRGFCGDSKGRLFFTPDGSAPSLAPDGTCEARTSNSFD